MGNYNETIIFPSNLTTWITPSNADDKDKIPLPYWTCFFIDNPSKTGKYPILDSDIVLYCNPLVKYFDEDVSSQSGMAFCTAMIVLVWLFGIFGVVSNILNISVLWKCQEGFSDCFKFLLIVLAGFEFAACLFTVIMTTMIHSILQNFDRSAAIFYGFAVIHVLFCVVRSGSVNMTILITMERCLIVIYPIHSRFWLTPGRTKCYVVIATLAAIIMNIPWMIDVTVEENIYVGREENGRLDSLPFIFVATYAEKFILPKFRNFRVFVDYFMPFPVLLTLNGLLYIKIHSWSKNRQTLSRSEKSEISAAKMFSVVMLILLTCHAAACTIILMIIFGMPVYREMVFVRIFSVTLSASVNILVYVGGKSFREELKKQVGSGWEKWLGDKLNLNDMARPSVTTTCTNA